MGLISLSPSENCYYNNEVCQFDEEESGTALTTLEMTSYGALAKMNFTDDIWEKLPNDTANGVAYYPSFKESTYVPSVKYTAKLELNRSGDEAPVYGDDIEFTTKALILFRNDYYGDDVSAEDTTGTFNAEVGGKTIIVVANRFEDTAEAAGDVTYKLIYKGSDYFPDDYSEDFIVTVGKKALTSDIIVGFPGETYEDFQETLSLIREVKYDSLFTFIYSPRKGTKAAEMPDPVSQEEKGRWFRELLEVQGEIGCSSYHDYIGRTMRVLCEGPGRTRDGCLTGKSIQNIIVDFDGDKSLIGSFVDVKITDALNWALIGELV